MYRKKSEVSVLATFQQHILTNLQVQMGHYTENLKLVITCF